MGAAMTESPKRLWFAATVLVVLFIVMALAIGRWPGMP